MRSGLLTEARVLGQIDRSGLPSRATRLCIRAQCGHTAPSDRSAPRLPVPAVLRVLLHRRLRAARIAASIVRALRHARLGEFVQKCPHPLHRFRLGLGQVVALRRVTLNLCAAACRLDSLGLSLVRTLTRELHLPLYSEAETVPLVPCMEMRASAQQPQSDRLREEKRAA